MKHTLSIRPATPADIPAVQDLSLRLFEDPSSSSDKFSDHHWPHSDQGRQAFEAGFEPDGLLLVATAGNQIVGYLSAEVAEIVPWRPIKTAEIMSLYLLPEQRGGGLGAQLIEAFFEWGRQQHAMVATVSAYADNASGIKFYQKMGFRPESLKLEIEL